MAPILVLIPDIARWTRAEKRAVVRIIRAKGGRSEAASRRARVPDGQSPASPRTVTGPSRCREKCLDTPVARGYLY